MKKGKNPSRPQTVRVPAVLCLASMVSSLKGLRAEILSMCSSIQGEIEAAIKMVADDRGHLLGVDVPHGEMTVIETRNLAEWHESKNTKATLVSSSGRRRMLRFDREARLVGALFIGRTERLFDRAQLREDPKAKIISDHPKAVCLALGIHYPDPQIAGKGGEQ